MNPQTLKELPDRELLARMKQLVQDEHQATATLVAHLGEIDCRKLYLEEGCSSLFNYCVQILHLSEHAAYNRIEAARVAVRFPLALAHLAGGDVHLTALRLLGPLLSDENHRDVLAAAKHQSKRQVEELIARLRPMPDVQAVVRRLPVRAAGHCIDSRSVPAAMFTLSFGAMGESPAQSESEPSRSPAAAGPACSDPQRNDSRDAQRPPATVVALAPERYKVQFTASAATHGKLRRAQELLRHRIPDGDVAAVIDAALDLLVRQLERQKFAARLRPQQLGAGPDARTNVQPHVGADVRPAATARGAPASPERSRHIPAAVKREVWRRDGGQCTFVGSSGLRCTERGQLEFDHIHPHADGGPAAAGNLRLLCRQHNQYEARLFFGLWQTDVPEPALRRASQA